MKNHCARPAKSRRTAGRAAVQSTSVEALRRLNKSPQEQAIFDLLVKHGNTGLTANEIENLTKNRRASSRIYDMKKAGWIVQTDQKKRNDGKRGPGTGGVAFLLIVPKYVREGMDPLPPVPVPIGNIVYVVTVGYQGEQQYISAIYSTKEGADSHIKYLKKKTVRDERYPHRGPTLEKYRIDKPGQIYDNDD